MTEPEVLDGLRQVFAEVFQRGDVALSPATTASDVAGWDSFKQIDIILAVEAHFRVKLRTRDIVRLRSVGDLALLVARSMGEDDAASAAGS